MIWKTPFDVKILTELEKASMGGHIGIEYVEKGDDYLIARMPVNENTQQPFGLLHGGASAALAESLGSVSSHLCLDPKAGKSAVGIELQVTHMKSATSGFVYGKVTPIKLGRKLHFWQIQIRDENEKLICHGKLTTMIIDR
jgi:1,4-dihydroxy-2-naphthoyl-CoA hydrolase